MTHMEPHRYMSMAGMAARPTADARHAADRGLQRAGARAHGHPSWLAVRRCLPRMLGNVLAVGLLKGHQACLAPLHEAADSCNDTPATAAALSELPRHVCHCGSRPEPHEKGLARLMALQQADGKHASALAQCAWQAVVHSQPADGCTPSRARQAWWPANRPPPSSLACS